MSEVTEALADVIERLRVGSFPLEVTQRVPWRSYDEWCDALAAFVACFPKNRTAQTLPKRKPERKSLRCWPRRVPLVSVGTRTTPFSARAEPVFRSRYVWQRGPTQISWQRVMYKWSLCYVV